MSFSQAIARFTPWGGTTPVAIPQQLLTRVKDAVDDKREVAVFAVLCVKNERDNWVYTCTNSPASGEVALMAATMLHRHVTRE